jgi:hypothetical protein
MAVGVSDKLWSVGDIVDLIDKRAKRSKMDRLLGKASYGLALLTVLAASPSAAQTCSLSREMRSPDGTLTARIEQTTQGGQKGCGESRIEILDAAGRSLSVSDFSSDDGEHGLVIRNAAWTPNSAFFVFSGYSSGGHEAAHFPVLFYARTANAIEALEAHERGLYVTQPDFQLVAPQTVEVIGADDKHVRFDLGTLDH